jgi:hypothetical protein
METNMLDMAGGPFAELLSFAEAAEIWNKDQSTLRRAVIDGRLKPGKDCRKFGKQWVVTADAMHREFGGWEPWSKYLTDLRKARIAEQGYY